MDSIKKEDFDQICRCCLSVTTLGNIFEDDTLVSILKEVSLIEMTPDDQLPKSLCENCIYQMTQFYILKKKAVESETTLKEILNKNDIFIAEIKIEECENNADNINSDSDVPFQVITQEVQRKPVKKVSVKSKIINCFCGQSFSNRSEYVNHRKDPKHPRSLPATCEICNRTFGSKYCLKLHMTTHTKEQPYECEICLAKFTRQGNYKRHLSIHTGDKPYICQFCSKSFRISQGLSRHISSVHFNNKTQKNTKSGESILKSESQQERQYLCSFCGKRFSSSTYLKEHTTTHTNERPHKCKYCEKRFTKSSTLYQHILTHKNIKFVCQICGKQFTQRAHLNLHMRIHNGDKRFQCKFCQKRFTLKYNCMIHERIHTGDKPYVCEVCSKEFNATNALKKHKRVHEKESK